MSICTVLLFFSVTTIKLYQKTVPTKLLCVKTSLTIKSITWSLVVTKPKR